MALNRFVDFYSPFETFSVADPIFDLTPFHHYEDRGAHHNNPQHLALFHHRSPWSMPSPGYEVHGSDDKYELQVELPGIKASEMNVEVENDGRVLHIWGHRKKETEDEDGNRSFSESRFDKRFTVGKNVETEHMTGNLEDGILTLVAPKKTKKDKTAFKIPITEDKQGSEKLKIKN